MVDRRYLLIPYVACLALIVAILPTIEDLRTGPVVVALVLQVAVGGLIAFTDRFSTNRAVAVGAALAYLFSVTLLRAGAGPLSGFGPLVLMPVMWMALQRRRVELLVLLGVVALLFSLPMLLVGAPRYPTTGWRVAALLLVMAGALGASCLMLVEKLRTQVEHSEAILSAMSEGFALTCDGAIIAVNPALCALTGFREDELVGARLPFPFWPEDLVAEIDAVRRDVVAAQGGSFEITVRRADGTRFPAAVTATATRLPDGRHALLNTMRDVTDARAHEAARERHTAQLEAIARVAREVGHCDPLDARRAVCRTALDVGRGAHVVAIWEPTAGGELHTTAAHPDVATPYRVGTDEPDHGARVVLATGRPLFVCDTADSPHVRLGVARSVQAGSALFLPIADAAGVRGVLAVCWPEPMAELAEEVRLVLGVLADEAAVAMQRSDLLAQLDELTRTDDLTGLPNRRAWDELLRHELAAARRHGRPVAVAMLDLDFFKRYNDQHGHLAGDRLLCEAAAAWVGQMRATDVLARWGGEEFALLLPGCSAEQAGVLVERLRGTLPGRVTFSAGISDSDGSTDPRALLAAADDALYRAKAGGRDRVVVGV